MRGIYQKRKHLGLHCFAPKKYFALEKYNLLTTLLFIAFILLPTTLLPSKTFGGPNKDLVCQDWLNGINAQYLGNIDRVVSYDTIGIKGVCKDFWPTPNERFKFERTNSDFFKANYQITRQYCWARNVLFDGPPRSNRSTGKTRCGMCKVQWLPLKCKSNGWTPPQSENWGETYSAAFDFDEVSAGTNGWSVKKKMKKGSLVFHNVCLRRYVTGEKFLHDQDGPAHNSFLPKVCAYVVNVDRCDSPFVSWGHALIGCVDEPTTPGPGVFNHVIIGQSIAYVDESKTLTDYINFGSTFDQPMISLTNGLEGGNAKTLTLRYKFPNDTRVIDSYKTCDVFPDKSQVEYCAHYDTSNPSRICACVKGECDSGIYVGCAPRPNLEQSNLKIKTEYKIYEDENGDIAPAIGFQFMRVDSGGNEIEPLPLTKDPIVIREYYKQIGPDQAEMVLPDSADVYGVKLSAMIPEFENGEPKFLRVGNPTMVFSITGCFHFAQFPLDDNRWPKPFVPAGTRNRDNCVCPPDAGVMCTIPDPIECADGSGLIPHDTEAVDAYCPGYYVGFENASQPDNICVANETDFEFITQIDGLCAEISNACSVSTYPSPSSGNATFPTPQLERGQSEDGECDIAMGFEYALDYSQNIDFSGIPDGVTGDLLKKKFDDQFKALVDLFESKNLNIPEIEIRALERSFGGNITIGDPVLLTPKHECSGNNLAGKIENGCRLAANCPNITKPSYSFYGATFVNNGTVNAHIAGTCTTPFTQDVEGGVPNMQCVELLDPGVIDNHTVTVRYWDRASFFNPCVNPTREDESENEGSQSTPPVQ